MIEIFISLNDCADEAISFYETVFEIENKYIMRFSDLPDLPDVEITEQKKDLVIFSTMELNGTTVHINDSSETYPLSDLVSLRLPYNTAEEVVETYNKLADGGVDIMKPEPTFNAKMYGLVRDKFGVIWHLICED